MDDFEEISFEALKKEIEKGYISIDYVPAEMILQRMGGFILRARNSGAAIVDTGYQRRTPCILWTAEKGCKLSYEARPKGGRMMIPSPDNRCISKYGIKKCTRDWQPYQEILRQLIKYFENKEIECSL